MVNLSAIYLLSEASKVINLKLTEEEREFKIALEKAIIFAIQQLLPDAIEEAVNEEEEMFLTRELVRDDAGLAWRLHDQKHSVAETYNDLMNFEFTSFCRPVMEIIKEADQKMRESISQTEYFYKTIRGE